MKLGLSTWLIPAKDDYEYLSKIIQKLGDEYQAPVFGPHLTIWGNTEIELDELKKVVDEATADVKPFEIFVDKINYSEKFFKAVFIEIKRNKELDVVYDKIKKVLSGHEYVFKPHMSLIYKMMPEDLKKEISKSLKIKKSFFVDKVGIVWPSKGHYKVESWKMLYEKNL